MNPLSTNEPTFESSTWVRAVRRELGLGQVEFGRRCGVSQASISKWENGTSLLEREEALEMYSALSLPVNLNPTRLEPCENEDEALRLYAVQSSSLIIQSGPDADWRAAQLCALIAGLARDSVEVGRILAAVHANRSLWHLVHQDLRCAARHAKISIRLGRRHGFNLESGYAFWSLARTRILSGFGSEEDVALIDRELEIAGAALPKVYFRLLRGARAMAIGDVATSDNEFERAKEAAPSEATVGVVGRWGETYWQRDTAMYHAMLALASGRFVECIRVIEPMAEEPFDTTVARQYGQTVARSYLRNAKARLGSRDSVETNGPLVSPELVRLIERHTARLSGRAA